MLLLMSVVRIKNVQENESTASLEHQILQGKPQEEPIVLKISVVEDRGNLINRVGNNSAQAAARSSACRRRSPLQKKSKIRSSRLWQDFKAINLEERRSQDVISAPSVTVR